MPVYAFIDNNAASAGALIAISCDSIYMREGANIGAATVVNQTGKAMPDKYQSYMRATIRSTAEAQGYDTVYTVSGDTEVHWRRNPQIAEAMVDERIVVPGLCDSTKVLTLTAREALQWGYCEAIAESVDDIITSRLGYWQYKVEQFEPSFYDDLVGFLQNPVVQGILIMLIIGGIYFEIQTPGVGFPLAVSVIAAILYFAPLYLSGLAASWEILVFLLGIILLVLELLVIPGFGIAGILGLICFFGGLLLALLNNTDFDFFWVPVDSITRGSIVILGGLLGTVLLSLFLMKRIGRKGLFYRVALHAEQNIEDGYVAVSEHLTGMVGREGVAVTVLFDDGVDQATINSIGEQIKAYKGVTKVEYVSAEEAWDEWSKQYFGDTELESEMAEGFKNDNPLANSSSYSVYVDKIEHQDALVKYIEGLDGVREVNQLKGATQTLSSFNTLLTYISVAIILILLCVAVFLISNTVTTGITVRKEEIAIMKYIGAKDFVVRSPFVIEGLIIGLFGAVIPLALLYFLYDKAVVYIMEKFSILKNIITFLPVGNVYIYLLPIGLAMGIGIGFLGSYFTVRKHLRV